VLNESASILSGRGVRIRVISSLPHGYIEIREGNDGFVEVVSKPNVRIRYLMDARDENRTPQQPNDSLAA
jgi:hypothetical protein